MYQNLEVFRLADAMARHAGTRQALVASNMANADTPGYKAQDLPSFRDLIQRQQPLSDLRATRSAHLHGTQVNAPATAQAVDEASSEPNGNSVSLETEMFRAVEVKRQHDRALAIYKSSLTILRASIGRR